jgi:dipeptidyl aminopeptidase/acylaminoacyl peptidase
MKSNMFVVLLAALVLIASSCNTPDKEAYRPDTPRLTSDRMTPEALWSFGRMSGLTLSPDQEMLVFGISYYNLDENRSYRDLYLIPAQGGDIKELTRTKSNEFNEQWRPDGEKIGYLSGTSGSVQLWEIYPDGTGNRQITDIEGGITGFSYSPDMKHIMFTKEVKVNPDVHDIHPDLPKANARIIDELMYRHWDSWIDTYSHVFIAKYHKGKVSDPVDIMSAEPWESPVRPFGGIEQITWSPDGNTLIYTSRKKTGKEYATSTNTDLYLYDLNTKSSTNLTEGMMGYDVNPLFSPDGTMMAWLSMERDGYEADKNRLFVMDMRTGEKTYVTGAFDQNAGSHQWDPDNKTIWFISDIQATEEIYKADIQTLTITRVTEGVHDYAQVIPAGDQLIGMRHSMSKPDEIYRVDPASGIAVEISFINKGILDQLEMGRVESRWVNTTDGKQMKVWIIYPPHFDPNKTYPALLYCQGGPQNTVSQFWSYRWNFQIMAANDYIIVAPNRRGLPGFGQEWLEQISGDYGGQNMQDYFSAIDSIAKEPYVDENRLGAVGASYGGFSVYWIAGHHENRFKAFIAHDGMFNFESEYLETEELWFPNWDLGGPFWDYENPIAQNSYANSPHRFVHLWNTPILVIHGEKDYRVTIGQGTQAFNAAQILGVPSKFLYFPEENHWVLSPQNGILWQREFFSWLDQWLKP